MNRSCRAARTPSPSASSTSATKRSRAGSAPVQLLRRHGIAARYVSGYLFAAPSDGGADSVAAEAEHDVNVTMTRL